MLTLLGLILFFHTDDLEGHHRLGTVAIFLDTFSHLVRFREEFSVSINTWAHWWTNSP